MNKTEKRKTIVRVHPASLQVMVDASWDFALRHLWNNYPFTEEEVATTKKFIRHYYRAIHADEFPQNANTRLKVFCERIMLAKNMCAVFLTGIFQIHVHILTIRTPKDSGEQKNGTNVDRFARVNQFPTTSLQEQELLRPRLTKTDSIIKQHNKEYGNSKR